MKSLDLHVKKGLNTLKIIFFLENVIGICGNKNYDGFRTNIPHLQPQLPDPPEETSNLHTVCRKRGRDQEIVLFF